MTRKQSELLKSAQRKKEEPVVPKEPPPDYEFLADPPSISAFDLGKMHCMLRYIFFFKYVFFAPTKDNIRIIFFNFTKYILLVLSLAYLMRLRFC